MTPNTTPLSKFDLLMHPIRERIMMAVQRRRMTTREIAHELPDISQASLYRHVAILAEAGVLYVAEEKPVRALTERVYALNEAMAYIQRDERAQITPGGFLRYFLQFLENLRESYRRYAAGANADPNHDGVFFYGEVLCLTQEELDTMRKEMHAATQPHRNNAPRADRRRYYIGRLALPYDTGGSA